MSKSGGTIPIGVPPSQNSGGDASPPSPPAVYAPANIPSGQDVGMKQLSQLAFHQSRKRTLVHDIRQTTPFTGYCYHTTTEKKKKKQQLDMSLPYGLMKVCAQAVSF